MTSSELRKALLERPFRPLVMHKGGGRAMRVDHPELMAVDPNGRTAIVYKHDGGWEILDILMEQSIEFESDNARRGRRRAG